MQSDENSFQNEIKNVLEKNIFSRMVIADFSGEVLEEFPNNQKKNLKEKDVLVNFSNAFKYNIQVLGKHLMYQSVNEIKLRKDFLEKGFEFGKRHFVITKKTNDFCFAVSKKKIESLVVKNLSFGVAVFVLKRPQKIESSLDAIQRICNKY